MSALHVDRRTVLKAAAAASLVPMAARADTTLNIWTGYPELVPWYKAVSDEFSKANPGVSVNILSTTLREHEQKLSAALPTGTGPDVFDVGLILSITFIEGGLIKPNPPDVDKLLRSSVYAEASLHEFLVEGKTYGLPLLFSTPAMFWNKAHFKEAGLDGPPKNFEEVLEFGKKLTKFDASGKMIRSGMSLRLSGQGSGIAEKFRFVLEPAGGSLIVPTKSGKFHQGYDNEAGRKALQFYIDAVQRDKIDDPRVLHDADAFVAGTTSMLMREAWVIGEIQSKAPTLDYDVAPIPAWGSGPHKTLLQHDGIYVSGKSRNADLAWKLTNTLTNAANSLKLTEMSGWVSARRDVDWKPLLAKIPQFKEFLTPSPGVQFYIEPVLGAWNEIESRLADKLPGAFIDPALKDNPQKVAETVHVMAAQTDKILKDNDLFGTD
jgi:multiple sugar transport system substrate-binding protein